MRLSLSFLFFLVLKSLEELSDHYTQTATLAEQSKHQQKSRR